MRLPPHDAESGLRAPQRWAEACEALLAWSKVDEERDPCAAWAAHDGEGRGRVTAKQFARVARKMGLEQCLEYEDTLPFRSFGWVYYRRFAAYVLEHSGYGVDRDPRWVHAYKSSAGAGAGAEAEAPAPRVRRGGFLLGGSDSFAVRDWLERGASEQERERFAGIARKVEAFEERRRVLALGLDRPRDWEAKHVDSDDERRERRREERHERRRRSSLKSNSSSSKGGGLGGGARTSRIREPEVVRVLI